MRLGLSGGSNFGQPKQKTSANNDVLIISEISTVSQILTEPFHLTSLQREETKGTTRPDSSPR